VLTEEFYAKARKAAFALALAAAAVWSAWKWALPAVSPFITAWIIASLLQPLMRRIAPRGKAKRACAVLLVLAFASAAAVCVFLVFRRIYAELSDAVRDAAELILRARRDEEFAAGITEKLARAFPFFDLKPALNSLRRALDERLGKAAGGVISYAAEKLLPALAAAAKAAPGAALYALVTVIAACHMTAGHAGIKRKLLSLLPAGAREKVAEAARALKSALKSVLKAYGTLFCILLAGYTAAFALAGAECVLLLGVLTAALDLLPVVGAGMILAPWGIGALIAGNTARGCVLLAAFAVMTLVREIAEPRLLGKTTGASPLISLVCTYAGYKLFGFCGMIVAPAVPVICRSLYRAAKTRRQPDTLQGGSQL